MNALSFNISSHKNIGRAKVAGLAILDGDKVVLTPGRAGHKPYFLVLATFSSASEHCIDQIPTGNIAAPLAESPDEFIVTDGESEWYAARRQTAEQLAARGVPEDPDLYLLADFELPQRLRVLTAGDKEHILSKIATYCQELTGEWG